MQISDDELRALVRDAIARASGAAPIGCATDFDLQVRRHASHGLLPLASGGDAGDAACLIEPSVRCNHCGYCLSFGH